MSRDDFKRSRVCSPNDLEDVSTEEWSRILASSSKSVQKEEPPPLLLEPEAKLVYVTLKNDETICVQNCEEHKYFASIRLDLYGGRKNTAKESDCESEDDGDAEAFTPLPENERLKPSDFFEKFVARTPKQCAEELAAPQRSDAWLNARKLCITASQFGAAIGESQYQTPDALVIDKLWNTFQGNAATEWGTNHEEHAKEAFLAWFLKYAASEKYENVRFEEENLIKFSEEPWMAVSPDGILHYTIEGIDYTDLVEFKCPAYLRNTVAHPYAKYSHNTPSYYYSQTQGIMGYINAHHPSWRMHKCWFVVWQPHQTWITLQPYNDEYYKSLHSKLETWYFKKLLPSLTHKYNNLLIKGCAIPVDPIELVKSSSI